jgi:DNA-binding LacI/PurR family transcriptional regulator
MRRKGVTLKALADRLNVSTATISRALNDRPGVSDELRGRILAAAREMGYVPHPSARTLATDRTHTVAFVVRKRDRAVSEDPFYPRIMEGAESYLAREGYHILLTTVDDASLARPTSVPTLSAQRVDGLLLAGPDIPSAFILPLITAGMPLVLIDNSLDETPANCVLTDDEGGAYAATRHLLDHGHTHVAFLSGPSAWISSRERARGYRRAVEEAGLEPRVAYGTETTIASGEATLEEALQRWPELTALCAANDSMAIGAIRAAQARGRTVPGDLCVVGFDDISWARMSNPPLTTVHVFKRRMGELAAQRLLDAIARPDAPPSKTLVSTRLVRRGSCREERR